MALSQFFVLSPRGDTIVFRAYRPDITRTTPDLFFRRIKEAKGESPPPIFEMDGIQYLHVMSHNLYFVATTKFNISPFLVVELLSRVSKVFKDYCGVLSEESLRQNFSLLYELMDEVIDFGYPQATSSDVLKTFVFDTPSLVESATSSSAPIISSVSALTTDPNRSRPSNATNKPISVQTGRKSAKSNELYIDVLERLTALFSASGQLITCEVDGCIQMKSYLNGVPEIKMGLNENLRVGRGEYSGYGGVVIDDCSFHECAKLDEFESQRILTFHPPEGEFVLMNYRVAGDFTTPFRVFPFMEEVSNTRLDVTIRIRADMPDSHFGHNLTIRTSVPKTTSSVAHELSQDSFGQTCEYKAADKLITWKISRLLGGTEASIRLRLIVDDAQSKVVRKEVGPVSLDFEISNYSVSGLQLKFLKVFDRSKNLTPHRWMRYITYSNSYVCRIGGAS